MGKSSRKNRNAVAFSLLAVFLSSFLLACSSGIQSDSDTGSAGNTSSVSSETASGTEEQNQVTEIQDISGLYLKVLDDMWETDTGLNGDLKYISVDLSDAPGNLSDSEKEKIAGTFAGKHDAQALTYSYDELLEKGYFKEKEGWKDGLLLIIEKSEDAGNTFMFDVTKWRGPEGADYLERCTVQLNSDGTWKSYESGGFSIS